MPVYEFICTTCGAFTQQRRLQEAGEPMACPQCQVIATRIYSTAGVIRTSGALRRRLERSAEPKVVTRAPTVTPAAAAPYQTASGRPWQLGHACATGTAPPSVQRI
jgi:putative FmdB family regulatory protein